MFHFSTDRLAGLDAVVLKIPTPTKVPTLTPNPHDPSTIPARPPLVDKTPSNNFPPRPTSSMLIHALSTTAKVDALPDIPSFRPLPPLPSASSFRLPSFLNLSTNSLTSLADPSPPSPPTPLLFNSSSLPTPPSCPLINTALVGPQWIPAFHHPNSPYVPWSSPVRRRILSPPSLDCSSSPCIRSGAVAPEPWTSSTFSQSQPISQSQPKSSTGKLLNSWKHFKNTIKKGIKAVVSRLGKSGVSKDIPSTYDAAAAIQPIPNTTHNSSRHASFVSSDSTTLATWLAERRDTASYATPKEMSVAQYELMGSWLHLSHCGGGWVCGIRECDLHSADGSPYLADEYPTGLRMAMPFDSTDLRSVAHPSPQAPAVPYPAGPLSVSPRFRSLPRLPCRSHSAQEAKPVTLTRGRELSMPGGWTFT